MRLALASAFAIAATPALPNAGFVTARGVTFSATTVETVQTMGRSQTTPPNAQAAASAGVTTTTITTTTTTTGDVTGPPGQINSGNYGCNNCTWSNETRTTTTETTVTGPGVGRDP